MWFSLVLERPDGEGNLNALLVIPFMEPLDEFVSHQVPIYVLLHSQDYGEVDAEVIERVVANERFKFLNPPGVSRNTSLATSTVTLFTCSRSLS